MRSACVCLFSVKQKLRSQGCAIADQFLVLCRSRRRSSTGGAATEPEGSNLIGDAAAGVAGAPEIILPSDPHAAALQQLGHIKWFLTDEAVAPLIGFDSGEEVCTWVTQLRRSSLSVDGERDYNGYRDTYQ
jgi:hypothetical protein